MSNLWINCLKRMCWSDSWELSQWFVQSDWLTSNYRLNDPVKFYIEISFGLFLTLRQTYILHKFNGLLLLYVHGPFWSLKAPVPRNCNYMKKYSGILLCSSEEGKKSQVWNDMWVSKWWRRLEGQCWQSVCFRNVFIIDITNIMVCICVCWF